MTDRYLRGIGPVLTLCLFVSPIAVAQTPWTVTITPTVDPLPIGTCGPVWVKVLDPATRDTPRNPSGGLVTIADFDLTVTSHGGTSVAGQYTDASHWAVCACQGASIGTQGTISAKYPSQLLSDRTRVPKVAFETTATVELAAARGEWNPPSCAAAQRVAGTPVAAPPAAATATLVSPPAPAPLPAPPPTGTRAPVPVTPPAAGPPPRNIAVAGTPAEAFVTWSQPLITPPPVSYVVERWKTSDSACCRATSPTLPHLGPTRWIDPLVWSGAWTYQVTATYTDGSRGSASTSYTYPEPEVPQDFKAVQVAKDSVKLSWRRVEGASYYTIGGPPTNTAVRVESATTSLTIGGMPFGKSTWQVAAMYQGSSPGSPQAGSSFATASLDVVNPNYRLVAEAIRVTTETADKPLSEDGLYDEVYVASFAELLLRGSGLLSRQPFQLSAVHGDVSYWLPLERTQAGSASANGGVRAGDVISLSAQPTMRSLERVPFVLWEGQLLPGKHDLVLHPMIVEVDEATADKAREVEVPGVFCRGLMCAWSHFMVGGGAGSAFGPNPQAAIAGAQIAVVEGNLVWLTANGGLVHLERHDSDRPVGLVVRSAVPDPMGLVGDWFDKMVILSSEKIEAALGAGKNRIEVRFWDHWNIPNTPQSTVNYLNGDYTLVIRIERLP